MTVLERLTATLRGDSGVWPADTDWPQVVQVAERHGVAMLLARAIHNDALDGWSRRETERTLQRARQLRTVAAALHASGIDVLPVKGPVLAMTTYGDPARRGVCGDLDLVVRSADFDRALSCLLTLGYTRHEGASDAEYEREQWQREAHLVPPALPATMIELHTRLGGNAHTAPLNLEDVFSRSRIAPLLGVSMRVMAAEDQLLYLCLHGAQHLWSRLVWLCDIDAIVRNESTIDWETLASRASAIDATERVSLGLHLAHTLLGTPLPSAASRFAGGRPRPRMTALVARRMAATSAGQVPSFNLLFASELAARETFTQRVTYLRRGLTATPRDRAWIRLPRRLEWLHVVLRPLRLLTRYGTAYEQRR